MYPTCRQTFRTNSQIIDYNDITTISYNDVSYVTSISYLLLVGEKMLMSRQTQMTTKKTISKYIDSFAPSYMMYMYVPEFARNIVYKNCS